MSEEYEVTFKKVKPLLYQLGDLGRKDHTTVVKFNKNILKVNDYSDINALMITGKKKVLKPLKREQVVSGGEGEQPKPVVEGKTEEDVVSGDTKQRSRIIKEKVRTPIVDNIRYDDVSRKGGKSRGTARTFEIREDEGTFEVDDVIRKDKKAPRGKRWVGTVYADRLHPQRQREESDSEYDARRRSYALKTQKYVETEKMSPVKRVREAGEWIGSKYERTKERVANASFIPTLGTRTTDEGYKDIQVTTTTPRRAARFMGSVADAYVAVGDAVGGRVIFSGGGKYSDKSSRVHRAREKVIKGFNEGYDRYSAGYKDFQRETRGVRSPASMSTNILGIPVGRGGSTRIRRKRKYVEYYGDPYSGVGYGSVRGKARGGESRDQPFNYL